MKPRIALIRKAARQLLTNCKITIPPVDLVVVARHCGLEYQEVDYFEKDVDALIIPLDGKVFAAVNSNSSHNRRRFSLAHELCHHLHHQDRSAFEEIPTIDFPADFPSSLSGKDPFESEADVFAGELLVPLSMLKKYFRPGHTASDIAVTFEVSQEVASIAIASHYAALFK